MTPLERAHCVILAAQEDNLFGANTDISEIEEMVLNSIELAIAAERERCARICKQAADAYYAADSDLCKGDICLGLADLIREGGK